MRAKAHSPQIRLVGARHAREILSAARRPPTGNLALILQVLLLRGGMLFGCNQATGQDTALCEQDDIPNKMASTLLP